MDACLTPDHSLLGKRYASKIEFILARETPKGLVSFKLSLNTFQYHRAKQGPKLQVADDDMLDVYSTESLGRDDVT